MNSPNETIEFQLEQQIKRFNACYSKSLELIRDAVATDNVFTVTERLRPIILHMQELEEHSDFNDANVQVTIQSSAHLTSLVERQKQLLICLLEKVQKIEKQLTEKQSEISPARDRQHQIQEMRRAYQQ